MKTNIEMAREAGWEYADAQPYGCGRENEYIHKLCELVMEAEREACAKLCEKLDDDLPDGLAGWQYGEAIRARTPI